MLARLNDAVDVEAPRHELLGLVYEALDQYEAGGTDLSALVHDVDSLIVELTLLSDPNWTRKMRNQWTALAAVLVEQRRAGAWEPPPSGCDRIAGANQGLRFLADLRPVARSS
ncbi:MAG TPA: hypothetical protein VGI55_13130 [Solirubrobacteraceae bacterium]